ncbi:MAG: DUF4247 domain-containing protein [Mycobacteriales bacterium]
MSPRSSDSGPVPFRRTQLVLAALLAVGCVLGTLALLRGGSPRGWLLTHFRQESHDRSTGTYVLVSDVGVTATTNRVRSHWKPAQEVVDPTGVFLRYHDLIVSVQPRAAGGSWIYVDDERHGYTHWYGHVGGDWGIGSPVGGTRGGGPGGGK